MNAIFEVYPNAVRMEVQMMEQLLGSRVMRKEIEGAKGRQHTVYEVASLGMPNGSQERGVASSSEPTGTVRGQSNQVPTFLEM